MADITCAIMQPTYWPWLGYLDMIDQVDVFVFLDTVQLSRQSWMTRNRIMTLQGVQWLSIPISHDNGLKATTVGTAMVRDDLGWRQKHYRSIQQAYARAPFGKSFDPWLDALYQPKKISPTEQRLMPFTAQIITDVVAKSGIRTPIRFASDVLPNDDAEALSEDHDDESKQRRLVDLCRALGATRYLSPIGAAGYIQANRPGGLLAKEGIEVIYHHYEPQPYTQIRSKTFVPYMACVDALMNIGLDEMLTTIRAGRRDPYSIHTVPKPSVTVLEPDESE